MTMITFDKSKCRLLRNYFEHELNPVRQDHMFFSVTKVGLKVIYRYTYY